MDKKIVGLVGAVSGLAMMTAVETAQARDVTEVLNPRSYAELLQPIPNAVALHRCGGSGAGAGRN
jgi:hypothetical protein